MTIEETEALIAKTKDTDPELSEAYAEMLAGGKEFPEQALWYLPWKVCLKENDAFVGDICFKGLPESGQPEIGYGIVDNQASKNVLAKTGFHPTGETGEEGPRFLLEKR